MASKNGMNIIPRHSAVTSEIREEKEDRDGQLNKEEIRKRNGHASKISDPR